MENDVEENKDRESVVPVDSTAELTVLKKVAAKGIDFVLINE